MNLAKEKVKVDEGGAVDETIELNNVQITDNIVLRKLLVSFSTLLEYLFENGKPYEGLNLVLSYSYSISGDQGILILQIRAGAHALIAVKKDMQQ